MLEREFRLLTAEELKNIYEPHLCRDFPRDELKPLSWMLTLMDRGEYEPYALFEDGRMLAYAFYWQAEGEPWVMLDYFAVIPEERNKGTGSALLHDMLDRFCRDGRGVFGEVEVPDTGDEAVDALRRRRLGFYGRAGLRQAGFRTKVFNVPFLVLSYGPEVSDETLIEADRRLYRSAFPDPAFYDAHIVIPWEEE